MPTTAPALTVAELYPELATMWHPTKNNDQQLNDFSAGSSKKVWWQCSTDQRHEWEAPIKAQRTRGCPFCSGRRIMPGVNDLATMHPELAAQWHPSKNANLDISSVAPGANRKVWWLCEQGHEWEALAYHRTKGSGCPYCTRKRLLTGFNDLATLNPALAAQWHPSKNQSTPSEVTSVSAEKAWWLCEQGHEWEAKIANRANGAGCPVCKGRITDVGLTDLKTLRPDLITQWHPTLNTLMPDSLGIGSHVMVWWICSRNSSHVWRASVKAMVRGTRCPHCLSENNLSSKKPKIAKQWHKTKNRKTPEVTAPYSNSKAWWQCPVNPEHVWETYVYNRTIASSGCPHCAATNFSSQGENAIWESLDSLGFTVLRNSRNILANRQELDLYLPEKNFAIEFNGVYWHSEAAGKGKDYHQIKQQACEAAGITLYQVWEDDWKLRPGVVLRGIAHRLGVADQLHKLLPDMPAYYIERIGARKTKVVSLGYQEANAFLNAHHIQGGVNGTHYLGLVDSQDRVRAVLVLKKTGNPGELSIERYATAGTVSGGFTKLLTYAEREFKPQRWVTFADLSVSDGGLYESTGFHVDSILKPDYSYLVNGLRVHKFNYRLKRFRDDPALQYEEGLTERELAALNGLVRVWDSGKIKYVKDVV